MDHHLEDGRWRCIEGEGVEGWLHDLIMIPTPVHVCCGELHYKHKNYVL